MKMYKESNEIQGLLTKSELVLFNNALNEISNGPNAIDESEFQTRTGFTPAEATRTLEELTDILDKF